MAFNFPPGLPLRYRARIESLLWPKPFSVCDACWKGPLSAHLGLFQPPLQALKGGDLSGGYSYLTSRSELKRSAAADCAWCELLLRKMFLRRIPRVNKAEWQPGDGLEITVGLSNAALDGLVPVNAQCLVVYINGTRVCEQILQTPAGTFSNCT